MIQFEFAEHSYRNIYPQLAQMLKMPFRNNRIELPSHLGKGYYELVDLGNGLEASINHYVLHKEVMSCRKKHTPPYFMLHFDELIVPEKIAFKIDGRLIEMKGRKLATAMLTSSLFDMCYVLPATTQKRSVYVMLTREWLEENLEGINFDNFLKDYLSLRGNMLNEEPFNLAYRNYFEQLFSEEMHYPLREMHLANCIMMLVEIFFNRLMDRLEKVKDSSIQKIRRSDLVKLMEVEHMLTADFSQAPPTIQELSKMVNLSPSKLKSAFKTVFGTGIYDYYQQNRMQKARALLLTGEYSVKEVGLKLGYSNLSNFSLAFKKQFGVLPSEI